MPFVVTVPGNTFEGITRSINHFQNNFFEVSDRMGVPEDEVGEGKEETN